MSGIETDMSFAFSGGGVEWSSNFPHGVFAQKRNLAGQSRRFLGDADGYRPFSTASAAYTTTWKAAGWKT